MERRASFWSRTPVATLVGVAAGAVLVFVLGYVGSLFWFAIYGFTIYRTPRDRLLMETVWILIAVGGVFVARFIASRLSAGKASLPATLIAVALALFWFVQPFLHDLVQVLGQ